MGDEQGGDSEFAQQTLEVDLHCLPELTVEGRERLVEEQELGPDGERPGHRHPLLLPARKRLRAAVGEGRHLDEVEEARDGAPDPGPGMPLGLEPEGHVLGDREVGKQGVVLKHHPDVAPVRRGAGDVAPVERDPAAIGDTRPATMRSRVVFPQPEGPSSETNSPRATARSTPPSTALAPKRFSAPVIARKPGSDEGDSDMVRLRSPSRGPNA